MYAVKGGYTEIVRELMEYEFLNYDVQNKVYVHVGIECSHSQLSHCSIERTQCLPCCCQRRTVRMSEATV
jgi:hypothetical protein